MPYFCSFCCCCCCSSSCCSSSCCVFAVLTVVALLDPVSQRRNTDHVRTHNHSLVHPYLDHALLQKNEAGNGASDASGASGAPSPVFGTSSSSTTVLCNFNTVAKMEPVMYRVSHHCSLYCSLSKPPLSKSPLFQSPLSQPTTICMLTLSPPLDLFIALSLDLVGHLGAISPHRPLVAVTQRQNGRNCHPQFKSRSGRTGYVKFIVFGRPCWLYCCSLYCCL